MVLFRQLFDQETSTYTYLLGDIDAGEACIIDPVRHQIERDMQLLNELGLNLSLILDTHIHADHVTGSWLLRARTGATIAMGIGAKEAHPDVLLGDWENITFWNTHIKTIATPGHTHWCVSYLVGDMLFTGDALLIRKTGRTDFQGGSPEELYHSIKEVLYRLPDSTRIFPGHDYQGLTMSTIGEEKRHNARIRETTSLDEFVTMMKGLHLEYPRAIDVALPANKKLWL